jgi:hypothetical protein
MSTSNLSTFERPFQPVQQESNTDLENETQERELKHLLGFEVNAQMKQIIYELNVQMRE